MIKFTSQQVSELFKRLDVGGNGYLSYQEFCELCEERIRDIDPFDNILQSVREKQQKIAKHHDVNQVSQIGYNYEDPHGTPNKKVSSYQQDFKDKPFSVSKNTMGGGLDFGDLGIIDEMEEGGDRRFTYDEGTVKNKFRNQTLKELKTKMMRNTQYKQHGFGAPTNWHKANSKASESEAAGGDMKDLIKNQYERDYL